MPEQEQDTFVQLINPEGEAVEVLDFGTHVEQLKAEWGYSDPSEVATKSKSKPVPQDSPAPSALEAEYNNQPEQEK